MGIDEEIKRFEASIKSRLNNDEQITMHFFQIIGRSVCRIREIEILSALIKKHRPDSLVISKINELYQLLGS